MADQGWRGLPQRMSQAGGCQNRRAHCRARATARLCPASTSFCMAASRCWQARTGWPTWSSSLRARVPAQVNVAVQTNGTLLDRPMLATLKRLGVKVGVSLDGDAEATGRHRRYANGRNSFDAVAEGLDLLRSPEFRGLLQRHPVHDRRRQQPGDHLRGAAEVRPACPRPAAAARQLELAPARRGVRGLANQRLRALVHGAAPGDQNPSVQRAHPARAWPSGRGRGARAAAEHADRGRHRRRHQATRLAQLGLSRRRRRRPARHVGQLRRRAGPPDHGGQATRRRGALAAVPGLPGDGDLRRRPVPAPVPAGRASATPRSTATTCSGSSPMCATGSSRTCAGSVALTGQTARFPRSAGCAAPPPAPRDAPG